MGTVHWWQAGSDWIDESYPPPAGEAETRDHWLERVAARLQLRLIELGLARQASWLTTGPMHGPQVVVIRKPPDG